LRGVVKEEEKEENKEKENADSWTKTCRWF
jgi:hypothetical protein